MLRYKCADSSTQHYAECDPDYEPVRGPKHAAIEFAQREPVKLSERDSVRESIERSGVYLVCTLCRRRIHERAVLPGNRWNLLQLLHGPNIEPEFQSFYKSKCVT